MRDYASILPVILASDLSAAGWDGAVAPYPGITSRQYAMQSQYRALVKKFFPRSTKSADAKAFELFRNCNSKCRDYTMDTSKLSSLEYIALGEAKNFAARFCERYDSTFDVFVGILQTSSILEHMGLGKGANIGSPGVDFFSKLSLSTMATTDLSLHKLYVQAISHHKTWADLESIRYRSKGVEVVQGCRLFFTPKNADISRTACTEAVLNMLYQKGIGSIFEERLRQVLGIDLSTQPDKNRELARIGSLTGEFGTIDLSSASDMNSMKLTRWFFPSHVTNWLEKTRGKYAILPDGSSMELHMVSTMGNAFTFPLETLLFSSLVYGAYKVLDIKLERPNRDPETGRFDARALGNFAVFGDDIIVRKEAYDLVVRLLSICGFSVNVDKSFNQGFFRESCGRDYYSGYNVRGIYIKTLSHDHDHCSAVNRLLRWSAFHEIPLPQTVRFLLPRRRVYVPYDETDTAGVKVPSEMLRQKPDRFGVYTYKYFHLYGKTVDLTDVEAQPPEMKGWFPNHSGILLAAIAGKLRDGRANVRTASLRVRLKKRSTPRWDWISFEQDKYCPDYDRRWKAAVVETLKV